MTIHTNAQGTSSQSARLSLRMMCENLSEQDDPYAFFHKVAGQARDIINEEADTLHVDKITETAETVNGEINTRFAASIYFDGLHHPDLTESSFHRAISEIFQTYYTNKDDTLGIVGILPPIADRDLYRIDIIVSSTLPEGVARHTIEREIGHALDRNNLGQHIIEVAPVSDVQKKISQLAPDHRGPEGFITP